MCSSSVLFEGPLNCAKCAVRRASVLFLKKILLFFKSCGFAIDLSGFSADVRSFFVGQHTVDRLNTLFHVLKVVLFDHGGSVAVQQIPVFHSFPFLNPLHPWMVLPNHGGPQYSPDILRSFFTIIAVQNSVASLRIII